MNKYEICVEAKITKKTYVYVKRETKLLSLIHTDLRRFKANYD
jgi:Holliday junction resolvase